MGRNKMARVGVLGGLGALIVGSAAGALSSRRFFSLNHNGVQGMGTEVRAGRRFFGFGRKQEPKLKDEVTRDTDYLH